MLRKIVNIFILILLLPVFLSAQEHTILKPDGTIYKKYGDLKKVEALRVLPGRTGNQDNQNTNNSFSQIPLFLDGTIDTLHYDPPWDTNFGYFGQDWMLQWFVCPAELVIKFAGFATNENDDAMPVELKIVKVNWTAEDLANAGTAQHGWYEALGNGYNDITAFLDNPDITDTNWISVDGGLPEPFGNDIWSDGGVGFTIVPVGGARTDYQWVDMSPLGEPSFLQGEIFGIAIKHAGPDMDSNRIGYWASGINPQWAWKFYANGRTSGDLSTAGWWTREFHWNFRAIIELIGDPPPRIWSFTVIPSGLDTGPYTVDALVTDDNPGDPANAGVDNVTLFWTNDGGITWNDFEMTGVEPNYTGEIPAQSPLTTVEYFIIATDINGNTSYSIHVTFFVFGPSGASTLVIYNGLTSANGYPQDYYFGADLAPGGNSTFAKDVWAYGPLTEELAEFYDNIYEFCFDGPAYFNDEVIRNWLETPGRNYFLAGQDWMCAGFTYDCPIFVQGSFEYDILGLEQPYFDVSFNGSGQGLPSLLFAQENTLFGEPIKSVFVASGADSLQYNPIFELNANNWIDAFDVIPGQEVDMMVETRGIGGEPFIDTLACATHRVLPNGNKVIFLAYDPLALNTATDNNDPNYEWIGFMNENTPYQSLLWFDVPLGVEEENIIPSEFKLSQNYPNPFNPGTKISWQIPVGSWQTLKVYDILGNEVASLVDEYKPAGSYEVLFDASWLPSGVYFYQLITGSFVETRKMVLIK